MKLPIDVDKVTNFEEARNAIEKLLQAYLDLKKENNLLREEIARLKGQPKKPLFKSTLRNQSSSVTKFLREKQIWHKGSKKGKIPVDLKENLPEMKECVCGGKEFKTLRTTCKIVQGIIFRRNNVLYKGRHKKCLNCGRKYKSILPEELKSISFDSNVESLTSIFRFACRMTQPLIYRLFNGVGVQISKGEINDMLLKNGKKLKPCYSILKTAGFKKSSYLQSDSTGSKRKEKNGKIRNQYLQLICNKFLSVFSITKHYNIQTLNRLLGKKGREKLFVSDDGSPNSGCRCTKKQLCWVHEIRHYKKLFPFFNPHQKLQEQILTQWKAFYHLAREYGVDPPRTATIVAREVIEGQFDWITSQTTGYDFLDKQLKLTKKKKDRLLLFLDHPYLPIHNNQCEQDLREYVIQRKISRETKSVAGDKSLSYHLSVIQTAQKQGLNVFGTLHGLLTGQLNPAILTANIS